MRLVWICSDERPGDVRWRFIGENRSDELECRQLALFRLVTLESAREDYGLKVSLR